MDRGRITPASANGGQQDTRRSVLWSLGGGLLASLCCVGPLVAVLLGVGGGASVLGLVRFKYEFVAVGLVVTLVGIALSLRRSKTGCSIAAYRRNRVLVPAAGLLTFLLLVVGANALLLNERVIGAASARLGQQSAPEAELPQPAQQAGEKVEAPRLAAPAARQLDVEISSGVSCPACLLAIQKQVSDVAGVQDVALVVDSMGYVVRVVYDPAGVDQATLLTTIADAPGAIGGTYGTRLLSDAPLS